MSSGKEGDLRVSRRRSLPLQLLAVALMFTLVRPGFGSPGNVLEIAVPILGGEAPATRDIKSGDASVSTQTGAFTYGYPITVPPGRLGIEPSLALNYSSQAPMTGGLAAGWSLSLPMISRDPSQSRLESTSTDFIPRWISSMAGDHELVPVAEPGIAGDVATAFRAQFDPTYARYEQLLNGTWRVRTTDGLTHYFGLPENQENYSDDWRKVISRTVDRFGNQIDYSWQKVDGTEADLTYIVDLVIDHIDYTSNPNTVALSSSGPGHQPIEAHAQVQFEYHDYGLTGGDCWTGGRDLPVGAKLEFDDHQRPRWNGSRRLDKIHTKVRNGSGPNAPYRTVRTTTLTYDQSAEACNATHGPLRILLSVQETAFAPSQTMPSGMVQPDPVSLPAVVFTYGPLTRSFSETRTFTTGSGLFDAVISGGWQRATDPFSMPRLMSSLVDFDGDGRVDRLRNNPTAAGCRMTWDQNSGSGFGGTGANIALPSFRWANSFPGPGLEACSLSGHMSDYTNRAPQFCNQTENLGIHLAYRFIDLDADGLQDLATAVNYDATCFDPETGLPPEWVATCPVPDFNVECPDLAPEDQVLPETCNGRYGCFVDRAPADAILGTTPTIDCGELMKPAGGGQGPRTRTALKECGSYVWRVHWNVGGTIDIANASQTSFVFSPVPLESNNADTAMGSRAGGFGSPGHAVIDIDGDGFIDVMTKDSRYADYPSNAWFVFRGDGNGHFLPTASGRAYVWDAPLGALPSRSGNEFTPDILSPPSPEGTGRVFGLASVMDTTGDGAADLFYQNDTDVDLYVNNGLGFLHHKPTDNDIEDADLYSPHWFDVINNATIEDAYLPPGGQSVNRGDRFSNAQTADVDGDGRPDFYEMRDVVEATAYLYSGDGSGRHTALAPFSAFESLLRTNLHAFGDGSFELRDDFIDIDGDGIVDWVEAGTSSFTVRTDPAYVPLRLMTSVDNGLGQETAISYRPSTSDDIDDIPGIDDDAGMPTHVWVVKRLTTTDASTPQVESQYEYDYGEPVWNADQHGRYAFRGFTAARTEQPFGAITDSSFDYDVDWSGRLIETLTSMDDSGLPHEIQQTDWDEFALFSGSVLSFQPTEKRQYRCSTGQTRSQCLTSAPQRRERLTWLTLPAASNPNGPALIWHHNFSKVMRGIAYVDHDRRYAVDRTLDSTASVYQLRVSRYINHERDQGLDKLSKLVEEYWSTDGAFPLRDRTRLSDSPATWGNTNRRNGYGLGLVDQIKKPVQYAANGPSQSIQFSDTYKIQPTSSTNELGHQTLTTYDLGTGALLLQQGPNAIASEKESRRTLIDGLGRPLEVYETTEDLADNTYREVLVQRFTYHDTFPHQITEERRIDWNGSSFTNTESTFDGSGRIIQRIRNIVGTDPTETFKYDEQGNLVEVSIPDPSSGSGGPPAAVTYNYEFDSINRPIRVTRPDLAAVEWSYNGLSTTRSEVAPSSYPQDPSYDQLTVPQAETTTVTDVFGRLVRVDEARDAGALATTLYEYDPNDHIERIQSPATPGNPSGIVTTMFHDLGGRRLSITRGSRVWTYVYDINGNMVSEVAPVPQGGITALYTTSIAYDALDRATSRIAGLRTLTSEQLDDFAIGAITFTYDSAAQNGIGRLASAQRPGTTAADCAPLAAPCMHWQRSYAYDARGNVKSDSVQFALAPSVDVPVSGTHSIERTFNPLGTVATETVKNGGTTLTQTATTYDERGLATLLTWQQMVPVTLASAVRNKAGLITTLNGTGVNQTIVRDTIGRVVSMTAGSAISEAWTYNPTDDPKTLVTSRSGQPTQSFLFDFDDRHQLLYADNGDYEAHFGYLADGRLDTLEIAPPGTPLVPARNVKYEYTAIDPEAPSRLASQVGGLPVNYGYEQSGNVVSRDEDGTGGTDPFTFVYDGEDQQRLATAPGAAPSLPGPNELYHYDQNGQRFLAITRQPGNIVTKVRLWHGSLEVEYTPAGTINRTLVNTSLGGVPIARIEGTSVAKRVIHNQFGHMLGAFDPTGATLDSSFFYGPFGEILGQSGSAPDYLRRFNGKEHDQVSDLYYYGARYFDPLSLSWTQADPLGRLAPDLSIAEPRRAMLYTYSLNNPLKFIDPDGASPDGLIDNLGTPSKEEILAIADAYKSIIDNAKGYGSATRTEAAYIAVALLENAFELKDTGDDLSIVTNISADFGRGTLTGQHTLSHSILLDRGYIEESAASPGAVLKMVLVLIHEKQHHEQGASPSRHWSEHDAYEAMRAAVRKWLDADAISDADFTWYMQWINDLEEKDFATCIPCQSSIHQFVPIEELARVKRTPAFTHLGVWGWEINSKYIVTSQPQAQ